MPENPIVWFSAPHAGHLEAEMIAVERLASEAPEAFDRFLELLCESVDADLDHAPDPDQPDLLL